MKSGAAIVLDPTRKSPEYLELEANLRDRVIGQDEAIENVLNALQKFLAGMAAPGRPLSNLLFLGPTGTGKTCLVEALSEALLKDPKAFLKIDCAEFQESHSISKLIGAPAGYVGHRDTEPFITQERLKSQWTDNMKVSIILFDEIEKAHPAFWDILLGVLDRATLTHSNGAKVDFQRCIIILTSNLGGKAMTDAMSDGLGFVSHREDSSEVRDKRMTRLSQEAARKKFSPEFFNRLDAAVTFRTLTHEHLRAILRIELRRVLERILTCSTNHRAFTFKCSAEVEDRLILQGADSRYGARHLKRVVESQVVQPLSNLVLSGQIDLGDLVRLTLQEEHILFDKIPKEAVAAFPDAEWMDHHGAAG